MSTFEVKIRKLDDVLPHPNADKLELAQVGGYRAVVKKGEFKAGDLALYIPNDSVIPANVADGLGIAPYLVGKYKNRVKAIRLRGEVSQGIVVPVSVVDTYVRVAYPDDVLITTADADLTDFFGIIKYEEEIPIELKGHVRPWPSYLDHYDIENVNNPDCIHLLQPGEEVVATEKLHGTNVAVSIGPGLEDGEEIFVCSRRLAVKSSTDNLYWMAVRKYGLDRILQTMKSNCISLTGMAPDSLTIRGEVVGIQDLKYGYTRSEPGFYAFDIKINDTYMDYNDFALFCRIFHLPIVPKLYVGKYDYDTLNKLAQGNSTVADHVREGIVVRPIHERHDPKIGRVILKFLNEDYLTRSGGTEMH